MIGILLSVHIVTVMVTYNRNVNIAETKDIMEKFSNGHTRGTIKCEVSLTVRKDIFVCENAFFIYNRIRRNRTTAFIEIFLF